MSARIKAEPFEDEMVPVAMDVVEEDDEDEIVREIDVYLSPALESQLHLIQFPLQHQSVEPPIAARIKPRHGLLELDQAVPDTFTISHVPDELQLPHRTHVSHSIPVSTHMALGKLEVLPAADNTATAAAALHLVPLSHISQMRPDFSHIDETNNPTDPNDVDNINNTEEEESNKPEKKPVLFQRKESERAALARRSSYAYKKASEAGEEWTSLTVHGPNTQACGEYQQAVVCPTPNTPLLCMQQQPVPQEDASAAFVHSLNYLPESTTTGTEIAATLREEKFEEGDLKQVCAKLTCLLQRGWPVPYSILRSHFSSTAVDDHDLLAALSSCAVLVRGNFVLQSRLSPLPAPMAQARTFILFLLQTYSYVQRFRLDYVYEDDAVVTPEVTHMLLQQVAEKCLNGWKLKLEDNVEFSQLFPEQTQIHLQYWERQATRFASLVQRYQQAPLK